MCVHMKFSLLPFLDWPLRFFNPNLLATPITNLLPKGFNTQGYNCMNLMFMIQHFSIILRTIVNDTLTCFVGDLLSYCFETYFNLFEEKTKNNFLSWNQSIIFVILWPYFYTYFIKSGDKVIVKHNCSTWKL